MIKILSLVMLFSINEHCLSQSKTDFIEKIALDSVSTYKGEQETLKGSCLIIKYTANPQHFLTALARLHTEDPSQHQRSENEIFIPSTSTPYWVYGSYSVNAHLIKKDKYTLIDISFKAYNRTSNYMIYGAEKEYQAIIDSLLKK